MKWVIVTGTVAGLAFALTWAAPAQVNPVPVMVPQVEMHTIAGTVFDPSGAPAVGLPTSILPNLGAARVVRTDDQGKYSLDWQPAQFNAQVNVTYYVMARDVGRNLVGIETIDTTTTSKDLKLQPGLAISGTIQRPKRQAGGRGHASTDRHHRQCGHIVRPPADGN